MIFQRYVMIVLFLSVTWAWPTTLSAAQTKLVTDSVKVDRKGKKIFLWHHDGPRPDGVPQTGPWYEWTPFEIASYYADSTNQLQNRSGREVTVCWFSGIPVSLDTVVGEAPDTNRVTTKVPTTTEIPNEPTLRKPVHPYRGRIPVRIEVTAYQQGEELVVYFTPYDKDDRPVYCSGDVIIWALAINEDGWGFPLGRITDGERVTPSDFKLRRVGLLGVAKRIAIFRFPNPEEIRNSVLLGTFPGGNKVVVRFSPDGLGNYIENSDQFYWR